MSTNSKNQDSVLGDYVYQLQKQKEERERLRREREAEIERQRKAEEARRIAEEKRMAEQKERLRQEAEARKRAEEERIRAKELAERQKRTTKKVLIAAAISVAVFLLIRGGMKIVQTIETKRAVAEATLTIEKADALVASYQFDEARDLYRNAYQKTKNEEAQRILSTKEKEVEDARKNADEEYENALKKLKILLDADDNVFNKYSNECLDKMIKIYPKRKETIYYKNLRGK